MRERRETPRAKIDPAVLLVNPDHEPRHIPCWTVDISPGGLAIELPPEAVRHVGREAVIELPLGRSLSRVRTRCFVRSIETEGRRVAHLEFLDESEIFRATVDASIRSWRERDTVIPPGTFVRVQREHAEGEGGNGAPRGAAVRSGKPARATRARERAAAKPAARSPRAPARPRRSRAK